MKKSNLKQLKKSRKKNPVFINDKNTFKLLSEIEGSLWIEFQKIDFQNEKSFYWNLNNFKRFEKSNPDDYERELYLEVLYGAGGMNRYQIHGNGEIILMKNKASKETIEKAKKLGFSME